MITYELAKELRDNGFPQNKYSEDYTNLSEGGLLTDASAYIPTLSELIEACNNRFDVLSIDFSSVTKQWSAKRWIAPIQCQHSPCCSCGGSGLLIQTKDYQTPEEAVARLWLALNVKGPSESNK